MLLLINKFLHFFLHFGSILAIYIYKNKQMTLTLKTQGQLK